MALLCSGSASSLLVFDSVLYLTHLVVTLGLGKPFFYFIFIIIHFVTISRIEWSYCASASISKKKKTLCIIVALHSKYTGALTFENFVMQSISQKKKFK